jgi:hypothetical protein
LEIGDSVRKTLNKTIVDCQEQLFQEFRSSVTSDSLPQEPVQFEELGYSYEFTEDLEGQMVSSPFEFDLILPEDGSIARDRNFIEAQYAGSYESMDPYPANDLNGLSPEDHTPNTFREFEPEVTDVHF